MKRAVPELLRGPVGDPNSRDSFERAQARMPDGWHVEGQHLEAYYASRHVGRAMQFIYGYSPDELIDNVVNGRQNFNSWAAVLHGARIGSAV